MTTRLMVTAFAMASAVFVSSCTKPPVPPPPPPPALRGGESYPIDVCKKKYIPTTVYKIRISETFDLRNPQVTKFTRPAKEVIPKSGIYDEDYDAPDTIYTWDSDAAVKTRLDVNVDLKIDGDAAMIKIILDDPLLTFRTDDGVIRAGGPHGKAMICGVERNIDEKSIRFGVFHYKEHQSDKKTFGKYNIGLIATEKDRTSGYVLPIYIDPMIKNNG